MKKAKTEILNAAQLAVSVINTNNTQISTSGRSKIQPEYQSKTQNVAGNVAFTAKGVLS